MIRSARLGAAAAGLLALVAWAAVALAAPTFPKLTGRVVDDAQLLTPQVEAELTTRLEGLERESGRQFVVVTLPTLQGYEIEDYGYQLGRAWGLGEAKADNGALLIVAPAERRVRIEVGYGLEPILTDAMSSVILQTQVLPRFKAGDMQGGVVAGADAVADLLALPPEEARAKAAAAEPQISGGRDASGGGLGSVIGPVLMLLLIVFLFNRRRRRRGGFGGALPWVVLSALTSSSSGRDRGGWGGGGFGGGGGGFSGGGGSFGGGGSSGKLVTWRT